MSNSTVVDHGDLDTSMTDVDYIQTAILVGAFISCCVSCTTNALVVSVTRRIRKFPFFEMLSIAELIFSFTYIIGSPARIAMQFLGVYHAPAPNWKCFVHPWVWTYDIGNFWPATVTLCIGIERLLASVWPLWYKANYQTLRPKAITILKLIMVLQMVPLLTAIAVGSVHQRAVERQMTWSQCTGAFGHNYHLFTNVYVIVCNLGALACAVIGPAIVHKRAAISRNDEFNNLERKVAKSVTAMVTSTFFLVIIPNIMRALERVHVLKIGEYRRAFTTLFIWNGAITFFIYYNLISDFRSGVKKYILKKKIHSSVEHFSMTATVAVLPLSGHRETFPSPSKHHNTTCDTKANQ